MLHDIYSLSSFFSDLKTFKILSKSQLLNDDDHKESEGLDKSAGSQYCVQGETNKLLAVFL